MYLFLVNNTLTLYYIIVFLVQTSMDQCIIKMREEILKMVMNENTMKILNQIIDNNDTIGNTLSITKIDLTRKQFYTKLNELTTKGLIKKEKGKYYLTTFGKIVYDLTSEY